MMAYFKRRRKLVIRIGMDGSLDGLKAVRIDGRSGYALADAVRMIRLLGRRKMGRFSLMKELGLGEATVKTMMKRLDEEGIIARSGKGQALTAKGGRIFEFVESRIAGPVQIRLPDISTKPSIALVVRAAAKRIRKGIEQRDEGVRHGVDVTTLVFKEGRLRFPSGGRPVRIGELQGVSLAEGDVVLVSSGGSIEEAKRGGLAVGLTLI